MSEQIPAVVKDGHALKEEFGLPLYVYDANIIRRQYEKITSAFDRDKLSVHFACKANSNIQVLKLLRSLGSEIDVVSVNEGKLAELAGFEPHQIHYTPNGVPLREYLEAIERGYPISVDNVHIIESLAEKLPGIDISLRINPSVMAGGHEKISVGHKRSKFGLPLDQIDEVVALNKSGAIKVKGLHIHTGSDIKDAAAIKKGVEVLFDQAKLFTLNLEFLDFGGGYKVAYRPDEKASDIKEIGAFIGDKIKSFDKEYQKDLKIVIEPGKYLVSEAGFFLAEVSQKKDVYGSTFVYVNAGFNHFIRPMYYDAYHHITNISRKSKLKETVNVVGFLCENDTFAHQRELSKTEVGDILCFHNAGAYSYTMSSSYNMRERPAEVIIDGENVKITQKRQVFKDLIAGQNI